MFCLAGAVTFGAHNGKIKGTSVWLGHVQEQAPVDEEQAPVDEEQVPVDEAQAPVDKEQAPVPLRQQGVLRLATRLGPISSAQAGWSRW